LEGIEKIGFYPYSNGMKIELKVMDVNGDVYTRLNPYSNGIKIEQSYHLMIEELVLLLNLSYT
jgi:hypothetical protein